MLEERILVTGGAGFIGFHLVKRIVGKYSKIIIVDDLNSYYQVDLKLDRLRELGIILENDNPTESNCSRIIFYKGSISDYYFLDKIFEIEKPTLILNLAAQAGVRYSIENPRVYIDTNVLGFNNILEMAKKYSIKNILYASSSSVYGLNSNYPLKEDHQTDMPASLYGVTKKTNELMAHSYSNLFKINTVGLRFFTVYGPYGRPDMALFLFVKSILNNEPIDLFNNGDMIRDFTFVEDIVISIEKLTESLLNDTINSSLGNYNKEITCEVFNIGSQNPIGLINYLNEIETALDKKAIINLLPMQKGDVKKTFSDSNKLHKVVGFKPETSITDGVKAFIDWYKAYYGY